MSKGRVLVVDDSQSIRVAVKSILIDFGFSVDEAEDGLKALAKLDAEPYDIVITDLNMPNVDGVEFTRRARVSSQYRTTPIVMLTTEGQFSSRVKEAKEVGVSGWVVKPSSADDLAQCSKHLLSIIKRFVG